MRRVSPGLYLMGEDGVLVEMSEQPYASEALLQELLERYPNLLAGDQMPGDEPRRWLFVARELSIPTRDGGPHGFLDHLFLDQDGIPTLVEVKRSSDSRIRREVVGQMLDYAANLAAHWPVDRMRELVGVDSSAIGERVGPDEGAERFWETVRTNLQAGRMRLVFVADAIPHELRRIVEFLNEHMALVEVIAIEVKQYLGEGQQILAPTVIGQTSAARRVKSAGGEERQWDEATFFAELEARRGSAEAAVARTILTWAQSNLPRFAWGRGKKDGSFVPVLDHNGRSYYPFAIYTYGRLEVQFQYMTAPPFDAMSARAELLRRLNDIPGIVIPDAALTRRPSIPLSVLSTNPDAVGLFLDAMVWFCEQVALSSEA